MGEEEFYTDKEENDKILARCEVMLKQKKQVYFDVHEFEDLIDHYIDEHKLKIANEIADIAIKQHPACLEIETKKAKLLVEMKQYNDALNLLNKLNILDTDNPDLLILKGICFVELDSYQKATQFFDQAISLSTDIDQESLYNIAISFLGKDKYDIALKYLLKAKQYPSDNILLIYDIAYCYERLGNDDKAIKYYNQYINLDPYSDNAWYNLGIIYNKINKFEEAVSAFDYVIAINNEYSTAYFNKANCFANDEKFEEAIVSYQEFLEYDPDNVLALYYIGECYEKLDQQKTAFQYFKKCIDIDEMFADGWYGLAVISFNLKYYLEGITYIKRAIELDPDNAEYWYFHGELTLQLDTHKADCLESYKRATELSTDDSIYWISYADALKKIKNTNRAIEILKKALTIFNNDAEILFTLAAYYKENNEIEISEKYFIMGVQSDLEYLDVFFENCTLTDIEKLTYTELIKHNKQ